MMGGGTGNNSASQPSAGRIILDALLIALTLGLVAWYRTARTRHRAFAGAVAAKGGEMNHGAEHKSELRSYIAGYVLSVLLTVPPFGFVAWHGASRSTLIWIIAGTAVTQIAVHFRFFLHINLSKSKRDDLQLILFSLLIVALMAGGTIWILGNLRARMM